MAIIVDSHNPISEESYYDKAGIRLLPYVSQAKCCFRSTACPNPSSYCRWWRHPSSCGRPPLSYLLTDLLPWPTSSILSTDSHLLILCQQCVHPWAIKTMLMCSCLKGGAQQRTHTEDLLRIALMHKNSDQVVHHFVHCSPWQKWRQMQARLHAKTSWTSC